MFSFWEIFGVISCLKILLIPSFYSTDFEVHRNWLAITHSLPISKWYFEDTSEWTLDYPPFFAYFEYILSQIGKLIDPDMLNVANLNYASDRTVLFQRFSVILTDLIFAFGTKLCLSGMKIKQDSQKCAIIYHILINVGLIFIDHIHFQYNGFLFGILLLSIGCLIKEKFIFSALLFAALLNLKHIFLYVAPVYGVFFLKFYCFKSCTPIRNLLKLFGIGLGCLVASFGPFWNHIPQVISRLFPFKRGLTHAYWAPNFWALYNFADKIGAIALKVPGGRRLNTGGLVQEYEHAILPSVKPIVTFALTLTWMIPCLWKLGSKERVRWQDFVRAIVLCSCTSFMFGWHVHEKAILMVIIPLSLLLLENQFEAESLYFVSAVGHFSLFPLMFEPGMLTVKISLLITFSIGSVLLLRQNYAKFNLKIIEKLYLLGFVGILIYENLLQYFFDLKEKLPFLPLMMTSVYCSLGILYFYSKYYYKFLSTKDSVEITKKKYK